MCGPERFLGLVLSSFEGINFNVKSVTLCTHVGWYA